MGYHTGIVRHCVMYVYIGPATSCFCRCMGNVEALMLSTRLPLKHTMSCGEEGRGRWRQSGRGRGIERECNNTTQAMHVHVYIYSTIHVSVLSDGDRGTCTYI